MSITPLPTPPSRDDPANFSARADAFLLALLTFAVELGIIENKADTLNSLIESSGLDAFGDLTSTPFGRSLLTLATDADVRESLGVPALSGAIFTGLVFARRFIIRDVAGSVRGLQFSTDTVIRWQLSATDDAETGANAGSAFRITRYSDAGAVLGIPILINRATGAATFESSLAIGANVVIDANRHVYLRSYTVGTLPTASPAAQTVYVSNGTTNKRLAVSDGTNWRFPDGAIVS